MDLCLGFGCSSVWLCRALFHLSFTAVTLGWIASYDLLLLYLKKKKKLNTPHCSFASYVTAIVWEWQTLTTNMSNKKTTQTHKWIADFSSFDCAMHVKCNGKTQADQSLKMINSTGLCRRSLQSFGLTADSKFQEGFQLWAYRLVVVVNRSLSY